MGSALETLRLMQSPILFGRHVVLEALRTGKEIEKIFLLRTSEPTEALMRIRRTAESSGIPVLFAPREKIDRVAGSQDHQGVAAIPAFEEYADLESILARPPQSRSILLLLDHLEDPQNLGSLLRTSDAVGVKGIVIAKRRAAGLTSGAAKASAGAIQHVPVARVGNLHQVLLRLREDGFTLVGADQSAPKNFDEAEYPDKLALVLGNEHKGLSFLLKNTCDFLVRIPMQGHLDSLNVAVAGALILYQARRQKGESSGSKKN